MLERLISAMTREGKFKEAIQSKIGTTVDTSDMEQAITEIRAQILDLKKSSISVDSIYEFLLHFDEIYRECTDAEKKKFKQSFVERIELYPERRKDGNWIKNILFNFSIPVVREDEELARIGGISLANSTLSNVDLPLEKLSKHETVCLLSKGDVKSKKIRVEFSLKDMDTDGFKKGATYNAIRDWIKEKYGYRVTNLNIAQVKQKHGIIERENYNKPKSENSKQPGCPEEKIRAIEDAMRYFQMI